jgi:hypothetical protein
VPDTRLNVYPTPGSSHLAFLSAVRWTRPLPSVTTSTRPASVHVPVGALRLAYASRRVSTDLQHLTFPTSMKSDVSAALLRDGQVEADYMGSITTLTDVTLMQAAIAPTSQILAGLATDTLRSDLGLPPTAQY